MSSEILLKAENIRKTFGITKAVDDVSLEIGKGEIRGIIGENGSGKSTFVSLLAGIQKKESGRFILNQEEINFSNQVEANKKGIAIIVQETGTLSGLTVAENIYLGKEEEFTRFGIKNVQAMNQSAEKLLSDYAFSFLKANEVVDYYDFEKRKLIELIKATYWNPKVLVIDETTTALSQDGREELYKCMKKAKERGSVVIFISHDLQEVLELTDSITILRDGKYVNTVLSDEINEDELKKLMVGREVDKKYYREDYDTPVSQEVVLDIFEVSVPNQLQGVSFQLHKGEILGIGGLSDCGIHEMGKAVFGASYDRQGMVRVSSGEQIDSISKAIKNGLAYTSKDRDKESLLTNASICDNICLPSLNCIRRRLGIKYKDELEFSQKLMKLLNVKTEGAEQFVSDLSGGNKQKVVLAKWIGKNSEILILDSPTRGIDIKVKAAIYRLLEEFKKQDKSIIMISEEIMELIGMCDRILVFKQGQIKAEFKRNADLSEKDLIKEMI